MATSDRISRNGDDEEAEERTGAFGRIKDCARFLVVDVLRFGGIGRTHFISERISAVEHDCWRSNVRHS